MEKIYGRQPVLEALKKGGDVDRVYILDTLTGAFEIEIRRLCRDLGIPLNRIPRTKLDSDIDGNHQGIYAVGSAVDYKDLQALVRVAFMKDQVPVLLLLDGIKDVRNIGAIARSAEVLGAHGIVIPAKGSAPINDTAIKTSAGALLHIPVVREKNLQVALDYLCSQGFRVIGADKKDGKPLAEVDMSGPLAIVMGSEEKGIDRHLKIYFDEKCFIPQLGKTDSLNVSVAAGIILYEISKQRRAAE